MKTIKMYVALALVLLLTSCNKNDDSVSPELELQNEPPLSFNLIDVADNSTNVDVLPTLSWGTAKNPVGSDVTYDLYLGKETDPKTLFKSGISDTSYQVGQRLDIITDYYWKVVAKDASGQTSQSPIHKFTSRNLTVPNTPLVADADFSWRANHTSSIFDEKLWVIGGFYVEQIVPNAWFSEKGIDWIKFAENSSFCNRWGHSTVVYQDKMYVIGGFTDEDPRILDDVWQITNGGDWVDITPNETFPERGNHTSVVFDDKIWIIGGSGSKNFRYDDVWSSAIDGIWTKMELASPSFTPRSNHASVVFDDKIWVVGGRDDSGYKNDVWSSADGINWILVNPDADFSKRSSHTLTEHDGKMWLIGGGDNDEIKKDIWYSDNGVEWTALPVNANFPARTQHTAFSHDNKIWIIAGVLDWEAFDYANDVWVLE